MDTTIDTMGKEFDELLEEASNDQIPNIIKAVYENQIEALRSFIVMNLVLNPANKTGLEYDLAELFKSLDIWKEETLARYGIKE